MELKRMETREDYNPPIKVVNSSLIIKSLFLREMLPRVKTSWRAILLMLFLCKGQQIKVNAKQIVLELRNLIKDQ